MTYEPFTLKYRPRTFGDVVGQKAVAATLARAVETERVANAYLFCGSRGVGKTSMARILAKALNCSDKSDGQPCNQCDICRAIGAGQDIDVIEIDGASNRGIDDVRAIRDGAGFVASRSPFKVYIIDEVHMLTIPAFNALLKVLEEPPPHVRFVFATTDPNNLPDTILSRCQRHEFRRISVDDIVERLQHIADLENLEVEPEALRAMATRSQGGMRDSVSALDQVVSYAGNKITLADLELAVGLLPRDHLEGLFVAIASGETAAVLRVLHRAFGSGFDPREVLNETTELLREMMVFNADPEQYRDAANAKLFASVALELNFDRVLYLLRLFLNASGEIKRSGHERTQVELTCLKAARSTDLLPLQEIVERMKGKIPIEARAEIPAQARGEIPTQARAEIPAQAKGEIPATVNPSAPTATRMDSPPAAELHAAAPTARQAPAAPSPERRIPTAPSASAEPREPQPAQRSATPASSPSASKRPLSTSSLLEGWPKVLSSLKKTSAAVAAALSQAKPERIDGRRAILSVPAAKNFLFEQLTTKDAQQRIGEALSAHFGTSVAVQFIKDQSVAAPADGSAPGAAPKPNVHEDPAVQKFIQHFDGGVSNVEKKDG